MTNLGDPRAWSEAFVSFDNRFLERTVIAWPECLAVLPQQPEEDHITINLVARLSKDPIIRRLCHWVEYQYEPFGHAANGARYSKGRIDIAVLFDRERDRYLAYECKRLNVRYGSSRQSLATTYVADGMMRFITEQYAQDLSVGCMLGYVLDGDVRFARARVESAIATNPSVALAGSPTGLAGVIPGVERFGTNHRRANGSDIQLVHSLLAHPAP